MAWKALSWLGARRAHLAAELTTTLLLAAGTPGTRAGAVVLGADYAYVGLVRDGDGRAADRLGRRRGLRTELQPEGTAVFGPVTIRTLPSEPEA
jgi:hypothetical protein